KAHFRLINICLIFILFQGCKIYQEPISLDQAINKSAHGYLKITMLNGDEFVYEDIEIMEGNYYGINFNEGEKVKTLIDKNEIKDVQLRDKKASKSSNFIGGSIGVLSIIVGALML
ncbi:hypothetical protein, partial [uncultured Lutibacter sp.]|uniref:hypothetical protein n=1 Tax=uncultured Lutibacter sp. TaxID=437739 RepID=UPI00262BCB85